MSFVRTVLGDIDPARLGVCYSHEHLIIDEGHMTKASPDFRIDDVEVAARELLEVKRAGGRALVDTLPGGSGRNVRKLAELSRRTGLIILAPTGLHLQKHTPGNHWRHEASVDRLAQFFQAEVNFGIDSLDGAGPSAERTSHRAGLVKVAGGLDRLDDHQKVCFEAAAIAHVVIGVPVLTHCEQGTAALEQVEFLRRHGVEPRHVVLSHVDKVTDPGYHREIASTGAYLEYDQHFRWKEGQGNPTRDLVLAMFAAGLGDRLLVGMDAARRGYWKGHGGAPGMSWLLDTFIPELRRAGLAEADVERILVSNPAAAFAFKTV